jgi:hypothetical protein
VHLEAIPRDATAWDVKVRGAEALAGELRANEQNLELYRTLATLRRDVPLSGDLAALEWRGVRHEALAQLCQSLGDDRLAARASR